MRHRRCMKVAGHVLCFALFGFTAVPVWAHCDGMDGPVVKAAEHALTTGDVGHAIVWVQSPDEAEIRTAFEKTVAVRKLSPDAKDLADRYFFETLVRVHRAGEGAPYNGLKPAGRDLGPAIPAADQAIEARSLKPVTKLLLDAVEGGLRRRFAEAIEAQEQAGHDVEGGRRYVRAYVMFIHYVERLYRAAQAEPHGHFADAAASLSNGGAEHHSKDPE